jgi:hypothetical protein
MEIANYAGVKNRLELGLLFDMDNDGYKDIYFATEFTMI